LWEALAKCKMERRFSVEAKTFSFSANMGKSILRLEEKRKGFSGFISLGIKCSDWLADAVEEALGTQRKEDFSRSFRDEVRVVKVRMGSNKAGYFLEAAVFVEGNRKGVIRLPEGRGGWGWQRFVDELRLLMAQLATKVPPAVPVVNAGAVGSSPSFADALVAHPGGLKSSFVEAQAPMGGVSFLTEALRSLAVEFLAKVRAEVDRVIFFGLGLKLNVSKDIRRRMGRVFSQLGLKSKLTHGFHLRGRRKRCLRPVTRVKADGGSEWVPGSDPGQGGSSSEKEEEATGSVDVRGEGVSGAAAEKKPMVPEATVSEDRLGSLTPARGGLQVLGPEAMADGSGTGSVSPAKGLHRRSSDLAGVSLGLELTPGLVLDPVLEPVLVLEQDSVLGLDPDPDPGLVPDPDLVLDQDPIMDPDLWIRFPGVAFLLSRGRSLSVFSLRCSQTRHLVRRVLILTLLWKMA
jgi:hypothetical protein